MVYALTLSITTLIVLSIRWHIKQHREEQIWRRIDEMLQRENWL